MSTRLRHSHCSDDALNDDAFAGSGSSYLVNQVGIKIMIQLGPEVINHLDEFVILAEGHIARTASVPTFVLDGGTS